MSTLVRDYTDADRSYLTSSWLADYWPHASNREQVSRREFDADLDAKIKRSLTNGMRVLVAYDSDFPRVIIGWIAFGPGAVLHYVYVGRAYRRQGVAGRLMTEATTIADALIDRHTHDTPDFRTSMGDAIKLIAYRPDLFPVKSAIDYSMAGCNQSPVRPRE